MSYSVTASGHTADADTERKLHEELAAVLSKPEYGCTNSYFGGQHVYGTIHEHHLAETEHVHETSDEPQNDGSPF